jgi:hypothetical protein
MRVTGTRQWLDKERGLLMLFSCLALLVGLNACGYKSPPLPPKEVVPTVVTDLRYELSEKGVTLHWTYPRETVNGTTLTEIASFDLFRAVVPVDSYCENCPIPFGEPIAVPGGALPENGVRIAAYTSSLLRPGHMFFFKVRSKTGWWAESEDSNIISFVWYVPPGAPENLKIQAEDSKIIVSWDQVSRQVDGAAFSEQVQYQVFRSMAGGEFLPIGKVQKSRTYVDTAVVNGKQYFYKVQAVIGHEKGNVGGGSVSSLAIVPVDKTAPAPPTGVKAVKTADGMKVFWSPVKENDVKGYRIYRRVPGDTGAVFVGKVNVPYTLFVDQKTPVGVARIFYSVSSFDGEDPANESAASPEAMIRNE